MKKVKVLGSGCKKCNQVADLLQQVADDAGVAIELEKVTDMAQIMGYGVMSTPGVVIDDVVVHKGSVPSQQAVESWLK